MPIHAALLWIAIPFAASPAWRARLCRRRRRAPLPPWRLAAPPVAVYLGKLLFNLALLLLPDLLTAVLFAAAAARADRQPGHSSRRCCRRAAWA